VSGVLLPGSNLGVLGGGQLGRMFAIAARQMGYRVTVLTDAAESPGAQTADEVIVAPYDDLDAVTKLGKAVDVVTFEFENVPARAAAEALRHAPVRPAGELLHTTQNRIREKRALQAAGLPVATFAEIESAADLAAATETVGFPAVLKTSAWGYDGHGQRVVRDAVALAVAFEELGSQPAVLERMIAFQGELSVVGARGLDGAVALYEPVQNEHSNHILDVTLCPAPVADAVRDRAREIGRTVLEKFDVVGVLCVELFWLEDGTLLVNELAPRPHNSGHVTIDAHHCSQFEQQVRAVCGLPLGSTERIAPAGVMVNLLGDLWQNGEPDWAAALRDDRVALHLYGKQDARPGRKMGHLTVVDDSLESARERALAARATADTR